MFTQRVTSSLLLSWIHSARFTECSLRACTLGLGLRAVWGAQDMSSRCQTAFGGKPPCNGGTGNGGHQTCVRSPGMVKELSPGKGPPGREVHVGHRQWVGPMTYLWCMQWALSAEPLECLGGLHTDLVDL